MKACRVPLHHQNRCVTFKSLTEVSATSPVVFLFHFSLQLRISPVHVPYATKLYALLNGPSGFLNCFWSPYFDGYYALDDGSICQSLQI